MSSALDNLTEEIRDVALLVHTAQERKEERDVVTSAHLAVERLSQNYRDLCASVPESERVLIERKLGRRVTDLRRLDSMLPRIGGIATGPTGDRHGSGPSEVEERRITGVSWRNDNRAGGAAAGSFHVGGDVDAWCGPCDGLTTHNIVAMVGATPKQVVCQACGNRHNFRTTPARKVSATEGSAPTSSPQETEVARRAEQKAEELRALGRELADVANVRTFNPRERYKVGEVIWHPEFGRGKVETVLRSSMLVRFASGGMKSVMLS
jgi:hypothetical protein